LAKHGKLNITKFHTIKVGFRAGGTHSKRKLRDEKEEGSRAGTARNGKIAWPPHVFPGSEISSVTCIYDRLSPVLLIAAKRRFEARGVRYDASVERKGGGLA
jgi:hypothetical protein